MSKFNLLTTLSLNASGLSEGLKKSIKDVENYVNSAESKNKNLTASFRDVSEMGVGELKKELVSLSRISFAGKSEEEIQIIKQRMGDLKDTMGDLKAEMAVMGGPGIGAVIGGFEFLSAGVEGSTAALSLFGVETDVVKKLEGKITSLIAVTHALGVAEDYVNSGKLRAIGLKLRDMTATVTNTVATKAAAIAQLELNAAMTASVYGAVALGVAGLVAGIVYLVKAEGDAAEAARKHYEEIKRLNEVSLENRKRIEETAETAFQTYTKQQIRVEKLVRIILDAGTSQKEYNKAVKELNNLDPTYISNQDKKTLATDEGKAAIARYLQALRQKAQAEANESALAEVYLQKFRKQQEIKNLERGKEVYMVQKLALETAIANDTELEHYYENYTALKEKNKQIQDQNDLIKHLTVETGNYDLTIANLIKDIDKSSGAVEFNTRTMDQNTTSLIKNKKAIDDVFDSYKDPQYFEYINPTMTPKGLPEVDRMKLAGDEGITVPEFNYDKIIADADALNERLELSRQLAGLATESFVMLGDAIGQAAVDGEMSFQGMVVNMLGGIRQIITARLADAMMGMMEGEASKGLPGLVLGAIGVSALTAFAASLPKFETGGIVPGYSFSGDNVLARVNSSEMILTAAQQSRLFQMANGKGMLSDGVPEVKFKIEDNALVGVLNKYNKKMKSITGR